MPTVTIEEAQTKLRDLIHNLLYGEELVITENNSPIARLTRGPRTLWPCQPGSAKDKSHWIAEDFDAPGEDLKEYMESTTTRGGKWLGPAPAGNRAAGHETFGWLTTASQAKAGRERVYVIRVLLDTHALTTLILHHVSTRPAMRIRYSGVVSLLQEARPTVFADLGYGVLDTAMVETAASCLGAVGRKETSGG